MVLVSILNTYSIDIGLHVVLTVSYRINLTRITILMQPC